MLLDWLHIDNIECFTRSDDEIELRFGIYYHSHRIVDTILKSNSTYIYPTHILSCMKEVNHLLWICNP